MLIIQKKTMAVAKKKTHEILYLVARTNFYRTVARSMSFFDSVSTGRAFTGYFGTAMLK